MSQARRAILPAMPNHDILTVSVSEAAAMLHLSEKTIRRRIRAGELTATKQPLDGGGIGWRVQIGTVIDNGMDIEVDNAMDTRRNRDGHRAGHSDGQTHAQGASATDNAMDVQDIEVDTMDNGMDKRAGTGTDTAMDKGVDANARGFIPLEVSRKLSDRDAEEIARQREEIIFLRGLVEQHQRSEAELRASLREALRAMPKQLTQGTPEAATPTAPPERAPIAAANNVPTEAPDAVKSPARRKARPLWRAMLGLK